MREFTVTIVDTPAANSYSDARQITNVCGYSLLVARRDKSMLKDLQSLTRLLTADHGRVVGTVLNES